MRSCARTVTRNPSSVSARSRLSAGQLAASVYLSKENAGSHFLPLTMLAQARPLVAFPLGLTHILACVSVPQDMDVTECNVRMSLTLTMLLATLPLLVLAAVPRRPVPRALFPTWYNQLWMFRTVRLPDHQRARSNRGSNRTPAFHSRPPTAKRALPACVSLTLPPRSLSPLPTHPSLPPSPLPSRL